MYTVFIILHVLCAGIWVGLGVVTVLTNNFRKRAAGTLGELYLMRSTLIYGSVMGNIGGIGILITGPALAGIHHLPWFAFDAVPWLAIKQVVFVIVLLITFAIYVPLSKKIGRQIGEEMGGANPAGGASAELRGMFDRIVTVGMIVQVLVLLNIVLGKWQPMF
jgi:hypothetical protein